MNTEKKKKTIFDTLIKKKKYKTSDIGLFATCINNGYSSNNHNRFEDANKQNNETLNN